MIDIVDGRKHPDWVRSLLEDYSKANASMDMNFDSKGSESVIAVKDGAPAGIMMFDKDPSFKINMIHRYPDQDDVLEPMLKSIIAMAIFQGKDSVTVHSIDNDGTLYEFFCNMGFKNSADRPCSLRVGTLHMILNL